MGRRLLLWAKDWFEETGLARALRRHGQRVRPSGMALEPAREAGPRLAGELNEAVAAYIRREWGVASRLEMEFEKENLREALPAIGAARGQRRPQALCGHDRRGERSGLRGMEVVRPVAAPVLAALGLEFDRVVGDDKQMALF